MAFKGGYRILDIGTSIQTGEVTTTEDGWFEAVSNVYSKPILVSGLEITDVTDSDNPKNIILPDFYATFTYDSTDNSYSATIDGYTLKITETETTIARAA